MNYSKYFPLNKYYEKVIVPLNPDRYISKSKMYVCPVHNDHDPSLGVIVSKNGEETCHCFGCNFWGNVVELHQRVRKRHFRKYISEEESLKELCELLGVNFEDLPQEDLNDVKEKSIRQEMALDEAIEKFDIGDFQRLLFEGKVNKRSIGYFNAVVMTMVYSLKE